MLANAGWHVRFLGISALGDADRLQLPPHRLIEVRRLPYAPPGWRQKLQYLWFTLGTLVIVWRWHPDWIYASDVFCCPAVFLVAPLGILVNVTMMLFLPLSTWLRLVVWLLIGLVIYFSYGYWHSVMRKHVEARLPARA